MLHPGGISAAPQASLLLACNLLLLLGLWAASRVIGWGVVAANLLNVINSGQLLVGGGLVAVGYAQAGAGTLQRARRA